MKNGISFLAVGHATSLLLVILFVLCVIFDFIFPEHAMYESWQQFLPGFEWISFKSLLLGFAESYSYGWLFAVIWVPIYNVFANYLSNKKLDVKTK